LKLFIDKLILILVILGPGLVFGFMGKPTEMGIAITAGAVTAAFMNLDKFQKFKGVGFEAEMKIQKAVDEAYATIDNLKELVSPLIISVIETLTYAGRWGGMDAHQKHKLKNELSKTLDLLSIKSTEVDQAVKIFHRYHTWDHFNKINDEIRNLSDITDESKKELKDIKSYKSDNYPSKENILSILGDFQQSENFNNILDDYDYYLKNKSLRRVETLFME
jgi:DNA-directed RNA polymerase subunit F